MHGRMSTPRRLDRTATDQTTPKSRRVTSLLAAIIAGSFMPMSADAAKLSGADKVALNQATVACKAEMKDKKIRWPESRRYINECLSEALKNHPNIKIHKIDPRFEMRG
jgi:hypothetical protein